MRIPKRASLEPITPDSAASFVVRHFRQELFPFVWHYHPEIELTLIARGTGLRFVGDSIESFGPGDLVLIGADVPHTWHSAEEPGEFVEAIVVQFPRELFGPPLDQTPEMRDVRTLLDESAPHGLVVADAGERDRIVERLHRLAETTPSSPDRLVLLLGALSILAQAGKSGQLRPLAAALPASPQQRGKIDQTLAAVFRYVQQALDDGQTPSQSGAADAVGMSPAAFSRYFHRHVGRPYVRYLNEWRVSLACRALLQRPDDSIIDVAFSCGFGNLSNFNRRFRELKGLTPRQFRAMGG